MYNVFMYDLKAIHLELEKYSAIDIVLNGLKDKLRFMVVEFESENENSNS